MDNITTITLDVDEFYIRSGRYLIRSTNVNPTLTVHNFMILEENILNTHPDLVYGIVAAKLGTLDYGVNGKLTVELIHSDQMEHKQRQSDEVRNQKEFEKKSLTIICRTAIDLFERLLSNLGRLLRL